MKKSKIETLGTRQRILSIASNLFMQNGLAETGIARVMAAAGLTQGGFYRHFRSKEHLIAEANIAANDRMFGCFSEAVSGKGTVEAIHIVVDLYLAQSTDSVQLPLCPLPNLGTELRHSDKQVRDSAIAGFQRLIGFFAHLTSEAGLRNPVALAEAVVATLVGSVMLARLAAAKESKESILSSARQTINAMLADRPIGLA